MVITSLTRNQVVEQSAREFESHRLRHEPVCGQCLQQALSFLALFYALFRGHFFCFCRKRMIIKSQFYKTLPCFDSAVRRKSLSHFKSDRFFPLGFFKHAIHCPIPSLVDTVNPCYTKNEGDGTHEQTIQCRI